MLSNKMYLLEDFFKEANIEYTDLMLKRFQMYKDMVLEWNQKMNLTAIVEDSEFIKKHFIDSLMCVPFNEMERIKTIVDIGTGAGFPGIPLSIFYSDKEVLLVDSLNKRIKFLEEVKKELQLNNVRLLHARAEDVGKDKKYREKYDMCVSRAVAKLNVLSEYALPLVKKNGYFAAYKGLKIDEEINESRHAIHLLGGKIVFTQDDFTQDKILQHQIIYIKKIKNTPEKYPRKAGNPVKNPL